VFGKKLQHSINIHKIYSGRDKESDKVALRLWTIPGSSKPMRRDYSILYYANDPKLSVKEHIEIFRKSKVVKFANTHILTGPAVHEIKKLTNKKREWLRVDFSAGTPSGKKLKWLEFRLDREMAKESKTGEKG
jgi:hypothetical protein